jgi:hypothetical protein
MSHLASLKWDRGSVIEVIGIVISVVGIVITPSAQPYLQLLRLPLLICVLVCLLLAFFSFGDLVAIHGDERIQYFTRSYVEPWQTYFVVKILLTVKETLNSHHESARQHLKDLIEFLETTKNTWYLQRILKMPSLTYLTKGRTSITVLKFRLSKCNVDSLSSKIRTLRRLESILTPNREAEVSSYIANVAESVVRYQKLKLGIAKSLFSEKASDEDLSFGVGRDQYIDLLRDTRSPQDLELELWNSLVPFPREQMTVRELRKKALLAIIINGGLLGLWALFTVVLTVQVAIQSTYSLSNILIAGFAAAMSVLATLSFVIVIVPSIGSYLSLERVLHGSVVFTAHDLDSASAQIIRGGLDNQGVSNAVIFGGEKIDRWDFIYRCACTFLPKRVFRFVPILAFPTSHAIRIQSRTFFHCRSNVLRPSFQVDLSPRQCISVKALLELSSRVVNLSETQSVCGVMDGGAEERLAWLYSNAVRIRRSFDKIEVAEVGRLAAHST